MKRLVCETCGGTDLVKDAETYVCKRCGSRYLIERTNAVLAAGAEKGEVKKEDAKKEEDGNESKGDNRLKQMVAERREFDKFLETYEAYVDEPSSLEPGDGVGWCKVAHFAEERSTLEDDRFGEVCDSADSALRSLVEKPRYETPFERLALTYVFDLPQVALEKRLRMYFGRRIDAVDIQHFDQRSDMWKTRVRDLYSSWSRDYANRGKELSQAREEEKPANAHAGIRKILDIYADLECLDGMIFLSCARGFLEGIETCYMEERRHFGRNAFAVGDLFGDQASTTEEAAFVEHSESLKTIEDLLRKATSALIETESTNEFESRAGSSSKYRRRDMVFESYAMTIGILRSRRNDCAQRRVRHGVFSDELPPWVTSEDQQAQIDAQIEELKKQMRNYYWDAYPNKRRELEEAQVAIEQIDAEIAAMENASCPVSRSQSSHAALIEACQADIAQANKELRSLGYFDFRREKELRSRIETQKQSLASLEAVAVAERMEEEEAFEGYRLESLKPLERRRKEAQENIESYEKMCNRKIEMEIRQAFRSS